MVDKTADILAQIKIVPPTALVDILFFICMYWQKTKQKEFHLGITLMKQQYY